MQNLQRLPWGEMIIEVVVLTVKLVITMIMLIASSSRSVLHTSPTDGFLCFIGAGAFPTLS